MESKTIRNLVLAGTLALSPFFIKKAEAVPIIIGLEAKVEGVHDHCDVLGGRIQPGDIITGFYSYDSSASDSKPHDPTVGQYWFRGKTPYGISLNVGRINFQTNPDDADFLVSVTDRNTDHYTVRSYNNIPVNGYDVTDIHWQLDAEKGPILSDSLPTKPPKLEDWDFIWPLSIRGGPLPEGCGKYFDIYAQVTSVEIIPEPSTIALLGLGTLALIIRRCKINKTKI